jgi:hypothetical protein
MICHRLIIVKPSGCADLGFSGERNPENSICPLWITCGVPLLQLAPRRYACSLDWASCPHTGRKGEAYFQPASLTGSTTSRCRWGTRHGLGTKAKPLAPS